MHFKFSSLQILNFLTKDALKCRSKNDGDIFGEFFIKQNYVSTVFKQANHEEESKIPDLCVSFLDQESHHWSLFLTAIEQSRASQLTEMQLEEKKSPPRPQFLPFHLTSFQFYYNRALIWIEIQIFLLQKDIDLIMMDRF